MSVRARAFVYFYIAAGALAMGLVLTNWECASYPRFVTLLFLGLLGALIKFRIPGAEGTVTVGVLVVLAAIVETSPAEAMAIALAAGTFQIYWKAVKRPRATQILFNIGNLAVSVALTAGAHRVLETNWPWLGAPVILIVTGAMYFVLNAMPVALVVSLTGGKGPTDWRAQYGWMVLFYVSGSCLAGGLHFVTGSFGWEFEILILPILFTFGRTYQVFLGRLDDSQKHAEELQALQFRSMQTLALAVEAKDENTLAHLHRVRSYAKALAAELNVTGDDLKALDAAAILHDIGKLAVPEHIIAKPGKLTVEEFDQMKVHTVVGAAIVEGMEFPYPVAPLVRAHHEKWDGSGYPDGLSREAIPMGARILSAVDCLDALASDRPYRRALPLDLAMKIVEQQAGKAFDPQVVEVLSRRYVGLEAEARMSLGMAKNAVSANVRISRGERPAAGFEVSAQTEGGKATGDAAISRFRQILAAQAAIGELSSGSWRGLPAVIGELIPHDALALFEARGGEVLEPAVVFGEDRDLFGGLKVPVHQGLVGWVAHNREAIINGDPGVEIGAERWTRGTCLHAALAIPLVRGEKLMGVLALYRKAKDSFSRQELGLLELLMMRVGAPRTTPRIEEFFLAVERSANSEGRSALVRLDLEERTTLRNYLPVDVPVVELRPGQFLALVDWEFLANLETVVCGSTEVVAGASIEGLFVAAERALGEARKALGSGAARQHGRTGQGLAGLQNALTAQPAGVVTGPLTKARQRTNA